MLKCCFKIFISFKLIPADGVLPVVAGGGAYPRELCVGITKELSFKKSPCHRNSEGCENGKLAKDHPMLTALAIDLGQVVVPQI